MTSQEEGTVCFNVTTLAVSIIHHAAMKTLLKHLSHYNPIQYPAVFLIHYVHGVQPGTRGCPTLPVIHSYLYLCYSMPATMARPSGPPSQRREARKPNIRYR